MWKELIFGFKRNRKEREKGLPLDLEAARLHRNRVNRRSEKTLIKQRRSKTTTLKRFFYSLCCRFASLESLGALQRVQWVLKNVTSIPLFLNTLPFYFYLKILLSWMLFMTKILLSWVWMRNLKLSWNLNYFEFYFLHFSNVLFR